MGMHRKKNRFRRIVVAATAVGAVGVPSVALACGGWGDGGGVQLSAAEKKDTAKDWWNDPDWARNLSAQGIPGESTAPTASASESATPSAGPSKTAERKHRHTAPRHTTTTPSHTEWTAAPKPRTSTAAATPKTTASPSATAAPPSTPKATATASGATARVVELVNAERAKVGCAALTVNPELTKAAQEHSEDMAAHRNMSHTGSDGSSPGDRITGAGYDWSTYGENVAYGYSTPEQVMAGWMSSSGHRANILDCSFKEIGVGLAQPGSYWTQDFGATR